MYNRIYLNKEWQFAKGNDTEPTEIAIPHTNIELPLSYFSDEEYQFVSFYSRNIMAEESYRGKKVLLTFEGIAHAAKVYLGDQVIGVHKGGYTAFTIDLAPYLQYGFENNLLVEVDSRESLNIPPFGHVIDYMTYGGIYRDVYLEIKEQSYVKDLFIKPQLKKSIDEVTVEGENPEQEPQIIKKERIDKMLTAEFTVEGEIEQVSVVCSIRKKGEQGWNTLGEGKITESLVLEKVEESTSAKDEEKHDTIEELSDLASVTEIEVVQKNTAQLTFEVNEIEVWDLQNPNLYECKIELQLEEHVFDTKIVSFGFRTCEFRTDGFYLNDEKVKISGLNRHQAFPYVGYAMPKRPQQFDADILKYELGVNAVRTSHYPQSHYFIERCDELGLLVFTELPGWQHIGNEEWKDAAADMTEEMVRQYRNHPSIILWGARINESLDDDRLYRRLNKIIHGLDDTRQTGGVRFLKNSTLLEDVYTYNDFSHTGKNPGLENKNKVTSNMEAPYLVTEYNGHMFPTKPFDSEMHRLEHAKRHANVLESLYANAEITGGFGWCMFDYNTHKDFGSGDRICYHGVMNMFRIPKLAASVYASQGLDTPVLEISSGMDIGEHPAGNVEEVYAFTNADYVKLYKNDEFIKDFYPNKSKYGHLSHPPILIDDFVGELMEKQEKYSHKNAETIKEVMLAITKYGQYNLPFKYKVKMAKVMFLEKLTAEDGARLYKKYIGNWGDEATTYRFEAIENDKVVKVVSKSSTNGIFIKVSTDTEILQEDHTYDVATVRVQVVNQLGEVIPYYQGVIQFETVGCIELIGPNVVAAIGGSVGTYVKTNGRFGVGVLKVSGSGLEEVCITYDILKSK
ncbi:MAG: glycoside hydrolase family 2 TIM barrel-domain containing protein [Eubacteriales bacterium]